MSAFTLNQSNHFFLLFKNSMSMKRSVVLQGLPHYLSEDPSDFFKSAEVDLLVNTFAQNNGLYMSNHDPVCEI